MNNQITNGEPEIGNANSFTDMMKPDPIGEEYYYIFNQQDQISYLENEVNARRGAETGFGPENAFSDKFIVQQALHRYFQLLHSALQSLDSMFTVNEMITILDANCCPYLEWHVGRSVAGDVADCHQIEEISDLDDDSELKILMEKLVCLSNIQNAALIDACERFWRNKNGFSFQEKLGNLNLVFA